VGIWPSRLREAGVRFLTEAMRHRFSTPTICSTENRFFFTHNLLSDCAED